MDAKKTPQPDPRVVASAERMFETIMLTASGQTKNPKFNAQRALAYASCFWATVDADPWTATAAERIAALSQ